jgi:hypothetical protein
MLSLASDCSNPEATEPSSPDSQLLKTALVE